MSLPVNAYQGFLALTPVLPNIDMLETRLENNVSGQVIFVGKTLTANADTSKNIWWIRKFSYDVNGFIEYIQLPNAGDGFLYSWDDRDSYFI